MKIRVLSDIHFEFYKEKDLTKEFINNILPESANDESSVLIMAGDMCTFQSYNTFLMFMDLIHDRFGHILYVIGNHEYYHSNFSTNQNVSIFEKYEKLHILNNESIIIGDVNFIGSTLWTDCDKKNPISMSLIEQGLNDFWVISNSSDPTKPERFNIRAMLREFEKSTIFISQELEKSQHTNVVITHHAPSFESVDEQFRGSSINGGFGSDLSTLILNYEPDIWIHGHMHNSSNYMIGNTMIVANPRGYPREHQAIKHENKNYNNMLTLTI